MSDQSVPTVDFDDNEYVWPVGDMPGVPAAQLQPIAPTYDMLHATLQRVAADRNDLREQLATAASEIEWLRHAKLDLEEILAVAMNTARTL
jgi:hypothetical protein